MANRKKTKPSKATSKKEKAGKAGLKLHGLDPSKLAALETFDYEYPGRRIEISFSSPEFTAICPFSDFPDFGTINVRYVPNQKCIELKSLKLYINSFRSAKIFHEHVVNRVLEDFVEACDPLELSIEGDFNQRGNIKTIVQAAYRKESRKKGSK